MLFFFVPFFWVFAVPALFAAVLLIRMLFWLRSLGRPAVRRPVQDNQTFIEGEFVDDEEQNKREDGSYSPGDPLDKRP